MYFEKLNNFIYRGLQFILISLLLIIIITMSTPYPKLLEIINNFRPEKQFHFFTTDYHSNFINVLVFIIVTIFLFLFLTFNMKKHILNFINNIIREIHHYFGRIVRELDLFFTTENKNYLAFLFLMIISGIIFRLMYIDRPVFHDESKTFYSFISSSWLDAISNYYVPNNHIFHSICSRISFWCLEMKSGFLESQYLYRVFFAYY